MKNSFEKDKLRVVNSELYLLNIPRGQVLRFFFEVIR